MNAREKQHEEEERDEALARPIVVKGTKKLTSNLFFYQYLLCVFKNWSELICYSNEAAYMANRKKLGVLPIKKIAHSQLTNLEKERELTLVFKKWTQQPPQNGAKHIAPEDKNV